MVPNLLNRTSSLDVLLTAAGVASLVRVLLYFVWLAHGGKARYAPWWFPMMYLVIAVAFLISWVQTQATDFADARTGSMPAALYIALFGALYSLAAWIMSLFPFPSARATQARGFKGWVKRMFAGMLPVVVTLLMYSLLFASLYRLDQQRLDTLHKSAITVAHTADMWTQNANLLLSVVIPVVVVWLAVKVVMSIGRWFKKHFGGSAAPTSPTPAGSGGTP